MKKIAIQGRARSWLTAVLAFLVPGLGHLFNGQYGRGFLLMACLLLNYSAIFRLADEAGGRHLLLIVYLCLMLPVFYFISVYDSLQRKQNGGEPTMLRSVHGLLLAFAGLAALTFLNPPSIMLPWLNELAEVSVGPLLMAIACLLAFGIRKTDGGVVVYKFGRATAAALILSVGFLLLWDLLRGRNDIILLRNWWPLLFVVLGIEMVACSWAFGKRLSRRKLDGTGLAIALIVAVTAYSVTQYADFPVRWLDQFNVDLNANKSYGEDQGFRYDKNVIKVPLDPKLSSISIQNPNGDIRIRTSDQASEIEIVPIVWVDVDSQADADMIAEQSTVQITPGKEMAIFGRGQSYGASGNRLPRINLDIVLPIFHMEEEHEQLPAPGSGRETVFADDIDSESESPESSFENGEAIADEAILDAREDESNTVEGGADAFSIDQISNPENSSDDNLGDEAATEGDPIPDGETGDHVDLGDETATGEGNEEAQEELPPPTQKKPSVSLSMDISNGSVDASGLEFLGGVRIATGTGMVTLADMTGPVAVKVTDGGVEAKGIIGESVLEVKNGTITAESVEGGSLYVATTNGNVELNAIKGDLVAETKNGAIDIFSAEAGIKADTLNGSISIDSRVVGGNWDLDSSVGEITLTLPEDGSYTVYGSVTFGKISTDLPLELIRKTVRGTVGDGAFRIHINATNSISIRSWP